MDPYLELRWEGVHPSLTVYARDAIQPQLPDDLWALAQERVYVASEGEQVRPIVPDAHGSRRSPPPQGGAGVRRDSGVAVAAPLVFELHEPLITEPYLTIQERSGGKVVTVIEFLSVANKRGGVGQAKYLEQQAEVLRLSHFPLLAEGKPDTSWNCPLAGSNQRAVKGFLSLARSAVNVRGVGRYTAAQVPSFATGAVA